MHRVASSATGRQRRSAVRCTYSPAVLARATGVHHDSDKAYSKQEVLGGNQAVLSAGPVSVGSGEKVSADDVAAPVYPIAERVVRKKDAGLPRTGCCEVKSAALILGESNWEQPPTC